METDSTNIPIKEVSIPTKMIHDDIDSSINEISVLAGDCLSTLIAFQDLDSDELEELALEFFKLAQEVRTLKVLKALV